MSALLLRQIFDKDTSTYTYLLASGGEAVIIDPVKEQVERDLQLVRELGLSLRWVLETHVHADHVTGAGSLREATGAQVAVSSVGATCADVHIQDGDRLPFGEHEVEVIATPGHTDCSVSFRVDDQVFTGDTLFVRGTGRSDFQNGDASALYDSITKRLFALSDETRVWPGHDYRGHTSTTVGEERRHNPRVAGKSREEFIHIMENLKLPPPKHLDRSVPANRRCGLEQQGD